MSFTEQEIEEFKVEALELLDMAEKSLLALDKGAEFSVSFDAIFRSFHNLKGAAGMMELTALQAHTHELENILMGFSGGGSIPKEYISLFLRGIDAAKVILDGHEVDFNFHVTPSAALTPAPETAPLKELASSSLNEFFTECEEIIERISENLSALEKGDFLQDNIDSLYRDIHTLKGTAYLFSFPKLGDLAHAMESSLEKIRAKSHSPSLQLINCLFKSLGIIETLFRKIKAGASENEFEIIIVSMVKALSLSSSKLSPIEMKEEISPIPEVLPVIQLHETSSSSLKEKDKDNEQSSSIRVQVSLLDNLMTLMGEMVLVRNQVLQYSNDSQDLGFLSMSKRLNVVTNEIQGEMMKTRMQPIGNVLNKFNRVVRDLSQDLHKKIALVLHGAETELDKSLLEAIKDPLTHIVRNACDHGIETPELRKKCGKSDTGTIHIKAYHEGGQVVIEVTDDGKGLHKDVIINKAIEKGLLTSEQARKLSEKETYNLIFAPGFSTAAAITNVSGRGVGMDVVRTNIEQMGGTVDVSSNAGQGSSIKLKIPLTLAIVPALIVKCQNGTFAIPQVKLEGLVRVDQTNENNKIEMLHGAPVFRLRGNILPLVDLSPLLRLTTEQRDYSNTITNIAVLNAENFLFGVIIDEVQDTADIVVKPLNRLLKSLQVYSGATILGDGSVALIFDVVGISKVAKLGTDSIRNNEMKSDTKVMTESQDFLLLKLNTPSKHAIALAYVHRLEEFKKSQVEYSGNQRVVRYGDVILPLISVNSRLGYRTDLLERESFPVVVIRKAGTLYGLEVDEILDTLSTNIELDTGLGENYGIFGNLNTKDELIVVVDPFEVIAGELPSVNSPSQKEQKVNSQKSRILLVEDTVFFRRMIRNVLTEGGYEVVAAENGQEALHILKNSDTPFDIIISDIEMPKMNGFELAIAVRNDPKFCQLPLVAVSSRADKEYRKEGAKAGFDTYLEKLKPNVLLAAISELTRKRGQVA